MKHPNARDLAKAVLKEKERMPGTPTWIVLNGLRAQRGSSEPDAWIRLIERFMVQDERVYRKEHNAQNFRASSVRSYRDWWIKHGRQFTDMLIRDALDRAYGIRREET
jgi:rhamnose utilization protein RhaD (predicted bifunctional aldolase and dehydrogenase)